MKIGIDIDGVVAEYLQGFCDFYNHHYKDNLKLDDFRKFSISHTLGVDNNESMRLRDEFHNTCFFNNLCLVSGCRDVINKLREDHDIVFISSREDSLMIKTRDFFQRFFPDNKFKIIFSGDIFDNKEKRKKHEICNEMGIKVLIEDDIDICYKYLDNIKIILLKRPWNKEQDKEHDNLIKADDWGDVFDIINNLNKDRLDRILRGKNETKQ